LQIRLKLQISYLFLTNVCFYLLDLHISRFILSNSRKFHDVFAIIIESLDLHFLVNSNDSNLIDIIIIPSSWFQEFILIQFDFCKVLSNLLIIELDDFMLKEFFPTNPIFISLHKHSSKHIFNNFWAWWLLREFKRFLANIVKEFVWCFTSPRCSAVE